MFNTYATTSSLPPFPIDFKGIKATLDRFRGERPVIDVFYADAAGLEHLRRMAEDGKAAPPPIPSLVAIPVIEVADVDECRARLIVDAGDGKRSVGLVGDVYLTNFKDKTDAAIGVQQLVAQRKPSAP